MKALTRKLGMLILCLAIWLGLPYPVFANDGHDWMVGQLRVDLPIVSNSTDYRVWILGNGPVITDTTTSFTTGWLSVDLPVFFQVGIYVDHHGYHWFAMTDGNQISCLEGSIWNTTYPYVGCSGDTGVWVSPGQYQEFELVSYGAGFWIARVYETNGAGHDVAQISNSSQTVTQATATFEQAWGGHDSNPYFSGEYAFWHPQYIDWNTGFQEWPSSAYSNSQQSRIYPTSTPSTTFCPSHYGAIWPFGDVRAWYAGTTLSGANMLCNAVLFMFNYLPLIENSS